MSKFDEWQSEVVQNAMKECVLFKLVRKDAPDLCDSREKALKRMHTGLQLPKSPPYDISNTDSQSARQVPQSMLDDQTRRSTFGVLPGDQGTIAPSSTTSISPDCGDREHSGEESRSLPHRGYRKYSEEATNYMLPVRSNLNRAQSPFHSSSNRHHPSPSSNQAPTKLPRALSDRIGPLKRPESVPSSRKGEQNMDDHHDRVRLRFVQTPRPSGNNEAYHRRTDSPMSVNPLVTGAGTEMWLELPGTGWVGDTGCSKYVKLNVASYWWRSRQPSTLSLLYQS